MNRVDLKIGFNCNNRCVFCVQGEKRHIHDPPSMQSLIEKLEKGREKKASALVLTGGEPTLRRELPQIIRAASGMGYTDIQVQTNGRLFAYTDYCKKIIRAGATEFSPALHGSSPKIHDSLTRAPGSFKQTLAGIRNLVKSGSLVIVNTVITKANYKDLPSLASLLVSLKVKSFQFAFVHILGTAYKLRDEVVPGKTEISGYVHKALDIGIEAGIPCYTEAYPYCFMKGYENNSAERIIPDTMVFDADITIDNYGDFRRYSGKIKGPPCGECAYYRECEGPWREYPEIFGWDEFQPVRTIDRIDKG